MAIAKVAHRSPAYYITLVQTYLLIFNISVCQVKLTLETWEVEQEQRFHTILTPDSLKKNHS